MTSATVITRTLDDGSTLLDLARRLDEARAAESAAKEKREGVERLVLALTEFEKAKGSEAFVDVGGTCKLVLNQPVRVSVDEREWALVKKDLGRSVASKIMRTTNAVEAKAMAAWAAENPDEYATVVSRCLSSKPGKVSVKLEKVTA